jgi:hypothetical protein
MFKMEQQHEVIWLFLLNDIINLVFHDHVNLVWYVQISNFKLISSDGLYATRCNVSRYDIQLKPFFN